MREAPRPWEEAYRRQGRLWRGGRLDALTARFIADDPEALHRRWLDAGCGDGKGLAPLAERVAVPALVGADRSLWGLRLVREHVPIVKARLVRADVRAWPFPDGAFAVVRAVHLLGHVAAADRARATAELARLVAPGGHLLVAEFGSGDFRFGTGAEVEPGTFRRGNGIRTHYFEADELRALVDVAGLEVLRLEPERFVVRYEGVDRPRERWGLVAARPHPGV